VAVPNQALAPVRQPQLPHGGQERLGFRLNGLRQQPAGAVPQDGRERAVNRVGLTEGNDGATARHGVSAPSGIQAGLHPPRYVALLKPSSPRFRHSSDGRLRGRMAERGEQRIWLVQMSGEELDQVKAASHPARIRNPTCRGIMEI
jgi:hypothetical protein